MKLFNSIALASVGLLAITVLNTPQEIVEAKTKPPLSTTVSNFNTTEKIQTVDSVIVPQRVFTYKEQIMHDAGIAESNWGYVDYIVKVESGWRNDVVNEIGCIGLIQACKPGLKDEMLRVCPDWVTNPSCQLKVASNYAEHRYGSWLGSYNFRTTHNWW